MKNVEIELTDKLQLVALTQDEMMLTEGGESAWYWVGYGAGVVVHTVSDAYTLLTQGPFNP